MHVKTFMSGTTTNSGKFGLVVVSQRVFFNWGFLFMEDFPGDFVQG